MANAQSILVNKNWQAAKVDDIVRSAISLFDLGSHRFSAKGPDLKISGRAAMSLSMAIHELCTNAVKYGALSVDAGKIAIEWGTVEGTEPHFSSTGLSAEDRSLPHLKSLVSARP